MTLRTRLARAAWHLKRAVRILVERNRYVRVDAPSTADWHAPVEPSHPSALCRCPGHEYFHSGHEGVMHPDTIARWQADARFIAAARSALPAALDRVEELEREAQRYAWATPAANVTRPAGCRCDLWPRGYCREGCPSGDTTRDRLASECEALRRERDAYKALATNAEHWAGCATNHGGTECDMGPECGLRPETRAELLALTADRDRLRALLREAVEIAREHAAHNNDDKDVRRLAAIAKEGLT